MKKTIRVLHVLTSLQGGGAETFIMNVYRTIDRNQIQFDFLLRSKKNIYAEEIKRLGGRVFYMPEFPRHFLANHRETRIFFEKRHAEYQAVHIHANALLYMDALRMAKKNGIGIRIMHSHNTKTKCGRYRFLHEFHKHQIPKLATKCFACSQEAGRWMFPGAFQVLNNGIEVKRFEYQEETRNQMRRTLQLEGKIVMGHVGRFVKQKNHSFLIEIFAQFQKAHPDSILLLAGEGELEPELKEKVSALGLKEKVCFLGVQKNIAGLLQAMDVFVFPSRYEGLPFALIEAQAAGLPCVISDRISENAVITDQVMCVSLEAGAAEWAQNMFGMLTAGERKKEGKRIEEAGFSICQTAGYLEKIYKGMTAKA